ncbi:MAG: M23 family metallopeptidase [Burkholderiaceae bacterium]|nr:M23 family metallopeptidase [Burkholderiaceae bacterium]
MQIILVHPRLRQARTINISRRTVMGGMLAGLLLLASGSGLLSYLTLRHAASAQLPFVQMLLPGAEPARRAVPGDEFMRQHIDALAVRLGHLQARLVQLDALGERVATRAGLSLPAAGAHAPAPGRGGPLPAESRSLSLDELTRAIDRTDMAFERRSEELSLLESDLNYREAATHLVPSAQPLADALPASAFGARIDPFTGRRVVHEGLDLSAPKGTPIRAAAAGVVIFAERHPGYGNQVDIDHGNGLVTRYAHASRLDVTAGEIVMQGQKIAEVGSTGRSTGPHLHFEVRVDGVATNPLDYLRKGMRQAGAPAALARAER